MPPRELWILIPCHSLEDFPTDLGEAEAAGLLAAWSAAYHPAALAAAGALPAWHRADDPPVDPAGKLFLVPAASRSWLPQDWPQTARTAGATVLETPADRGEIVATLLDAVANTPPIATELAADFLAFGSAVLHLELLTRRMHYYSNLDSAPLRPELLAAAHAAVAGDDEEARRRLSRCFELLLEARERFFPVECYLIDLCLLIPRLAEHLPLALEAGTLNLLATAADWTEIAGTQPDLIDRLKTAWRGDRVCLVGGEWSEGPVGVLPIESLLQNFERGLAAYQHLFDRTPKIWGRRRFGLTNLLPQILDRAGMTAALHIVLDDGIYPDEELTKLRWDGCDGTAIDAFSRIPLAADSSTSFLRFATRLAESMELDQAAAVMFARWPEVKTPWLADLRRITKYAPIFGKFVTLETFFNDTDPPSRTLRPVAKDYFPPYLTQAVARKQADPLSGFGNAVGRRHLSEAAAWLRSASGLLSGRSLPEPPEILDERAEASDPGFERHANLQADQNLTAAAQSLAAVLLSGAPAGKGWLILNPLAVPRRVALDWPADRGLPAVGGAIKHVQPPGGTAWKAVPTALDETLSFSLTGHEEQQPIGGVVLDLPAAGFQWIPAGDHKPPAPKRGEPPMAEGNVLRNEFFEVHLNTTTGGIAYIKNHGRSPKRLSQQLTYRFPRARPIAAAEQTGDWDAETSPYAEMRCQSLSLTFTGPTLAEAQSLGEIVDQANGEVLAKFLQYVRVWRGCRRVELRVHLFEPRPPQGDPWTNHFACRWAWNDAAAIVTRSVQGTAQPAGEGRWDAADYIEIAEGETRTTIIPHSTIFHRQTGPRMLDTPLIVAGETAGTFHFTIAIDEPYPLRAALEARVPPVVVPTETGPPVSGPAGWLLRTDAKNVQISGVRPLAGEAGEADHRGDYSPRSPVGLRMRLQETEGQARRVRLSLFRTPTSARLLDLTGAQIAVLPTDGDGVLLDLHRYEIATLELRF